MARLSTRENVVPFVMLSFTNFHSLHLLPSFHFHVNLIQSLRNHHWSILLGNEESRSSKSLRTSDFNSMKIICMNLGFLSLTQINALASRNHQQFQTRFTSFTVASFVLRQVMFSLSLSKTTWRILKRQEIKSLTNMMQTRCNQRMNRRGRPRTSAHVAAWIKARSSRACASYRRRCRLRRLGLPPFAGHLPWSGTPDGQPSSAGTPCWDSPVARSRPQSASAGRRRGSTLAPRLCSCFAGRAGGWARAWAGTARSGRRREWELDCGKRPAWAWASLVPPSASPF